jgi:hypothetical protein
MLEGKIERISQKTSNNISLQQASSRAKEDCYQFI